MGVYLSVACTDVDAEEGCGNKLRYAVGEMQGWRKHMEDAHIACPDLGEELKKDYAENVAVFGVFDGHGGKEVAKFVQLKYLEQLVNLDAFREGRIEDALRQSFHKIDELLEDEQYDPMLQQFRKIPSPSEHNDNRDNNTAAQRKVQPLSGITVTMHPAENGSADSNNKEIITGERSPRPPPRSSSDDGAGEGKDGSRRKKSLSTSQAVELFKQLLMRETLTRKGSDAAADSKNAVIGTAGSGAAGGGSAAAASQKAGVSAFDADFHTVNNLDSDGSNEDSGSKDEHHRRIMSTDSEDIRVGLGLHTCKDTSSSSSSGSPEYGLLPSILASDSKAVASVSGDEEKSLEAAAIAAAAAFDDSEKNVAGAGAGDEDDGRPIEDIDDEAARVEAQLEIARAHMVDALKVRGEAAAAAAAGGNKKSGQSAESTTDGGAAVGDDGKILVTEDKKAAAKEVGEGSMSAAAGEEPKDEQVDVADDLTSKNGIGKDGKWGPASIRTANGAICNLKDHRVMAGCTAIVALKFKNKLFVANAGDSRGVLCRKSGLAVPLSEDHKPQNDIELRRIEAAGGFVNAVGRVNGNLNLSRSLGDLKYKQVPNVPPAEQIITAEPDITITELEPGDRFFVLACDGIWDCLTCQQAVDFVSERLAAGHTTVQVVDNVLQQCLSVDPRRTGGIGGDNMTFLLVMLDELADMSTIADAKDGGDKASSSSSAAAAAASKDGSSSSLTKDADDGSSDGSSKEGASTASASAAYVSSDPDTLSEAKESKKDFATVTELSASKNDVGGASLSLQADKKIPSSSPVEQHSRSVKRAISFKLGTSGGSVAGANPSATSAASSANTSASSTGV